jgi:hypothetical protein
LIERSDEFYPGNIFLPAARHRVEYRHIIAIQIEKKEKSTGAMGIF